MILKPLKIALLFTSYIGLSQLSHAAELDISIQNLTKGMSYTPFIVAGHGSNYHFFKAGEQATPALQAMAEGGDISGLTAAAAAANAVVVENPNGGILAPGAATPVFSINTGSNEYLSIAAMLLPTNDAFAGLDSWHIPTQAGTYTLNLNAYDAGTEANNELLDTTNGGAPGNLGIPAAPQGDAGANGTGVSDTSSNDKVHIHPGALGDFNSTGGQSDLDATIHRWLNPVVRVTVTVK